LGVVVVDKKLEERLRTAIRETEGFLDDSVVIRLADAKRLLYRLKKENSAPEALVYRKRKRKDKK
jgi:hypothetical protein